MKHILIKNNNRIYTEPDITEGHMKCNVMHNMMTYILYLLSRVINNGRTDFETLLNIGTVTLILTYL